MSWNERMTEAYIAGLADAKAGREAMPDAWEFRAAYLQGYSHGGGDHVENCLCRRCKE